MLSNFPEYFQWFFVAPRNSTRHAHDMTRNVVSDFLLGSGELSRLGIIDPEAVALADREKRTDLLGIACLRDRKHNPAHRPPTVDAALLRDKIVQAVLFERVSHPKEQMRIRAEAIENALPIIRQAHAVSNE